jgi:hypothetical protein
VCVAVQDAALAAFFLHGCQSLGQLLKGRKEREERYIVQDEGDGDAGVVGPLRIETLFAEAWYSRFWLVY